MWSKRNSSWSNAKITNKMSRLCNPVLPTKTKIRNKWHKLTQTPETKINRRENSWTKTQKSCSALLLHRKNTNTILSQSEGFGKRQERCLCCFCLGGTAGIRHWGLNCGRSIFTNSWQVPEPQEHQSEGTGETKTTGTWPSTHSTYINNNTASVVKLFILVIWYVDGFASTYQQWLDIFLWISAVS